jgi:hypothetical protein
MSAVILVIVHKAEPSSFERVSLIQCGKVFTRRRIVFICPEGLDVSEYRQLCPSADVEFIDPSWQKDYAQFNRLKVVPLLYEKFSSYQYILFYEPDAFVFRDELDKWCAEDYDYLGAPWFEGFSSKEGEGNFMGVGNGGFSLRKISSHLKVLNTFSLVTSVSENLAKRSKYGVTVKDKVKHTVGFLLDLTIRNNTHKWFNNFAGYEDQFWGMKVAKKFEWFRVPDYPQAAAFAFEMQPRRLFELNGNQLPFGCHAWWKYDLEFWKPHIERFGFNLSV